MYADDTTIMNVGHDVNELQKITAANTGVVEQHFEINNLLINPSKHTTSFPRQNIADRKFKNANKEQ
jgi:hypothetical protein